MRRCAASLALGCHRSRRRQGRDVPLFERAPNIARDGLKAMDFYQRAFEATEVSRTPDKRWQQASARPARPRGHLLYVSDEFEPTEGVAANHRRRSVEPRFGSRSSCMTPTRSFNERSGSSPGPYGAGGSTERWVSRALLQPTLIETARVARVTARRATRAPGVSLVGYPPWCPSESARVLGDARFEIRRHSSHAGHIAQISADSRRAR